VAENLGESLVAYFAALLARTEDGWDVSETELDDVETLADLADLAREAAEDEETVLVFIEQEDSWFAVVRVDGEEDPRIFVSDASAASRSAYGEIVLTDELLGRDSESVLDALVIDLDSDEAGAHDATDEDDEEEEDAGVDPDGVPTGPLGDAGLLIEFGVGAKELMDMSVEGSVPGDALSEIAEALGCGEVLEAVR
jgi:putative tRNA adenosine deaminase-associated protein